jgi:hypothetical protein
MSWTSEVKFGSSDLTAMLLSIYGFRENRCNIHNVHYTSLVGGANEILTCFNDFLLTF